MKTIPETKLEQSKVPNVKVKEMKTGLGIDEDLNCKPCSLALLFILSNRMRLQGPGTEIYRE